MISNCLQMPKRKLKKSQKPPAICLYPSWASQPQEIRILVVSWNMAGSLPDSENLSRLLKPMRLQNDLIVIGTAQAIQGRSSASTHKSCPSSSAARRAGKGCSESTWRGSRLSTQKG